MQINIEEISKKIDRLLDNGVKNRNKILNEVFAEDGEIIRVLKLCMKQKSESEIMVELKMPINVIKNDINLLQTVSRLIDSKISKISSGKFYMNKVIQENMPHNTKEELDESITKARKDEINKKRNAREYLKKYFLEYMLDKRMRYK